MDRSTTTIHQYDLSVMHNMIFNIDIICGMAVSLLCVVYAALKQLNNIKQSVANEHAMRASRQLRIQREVKLAKRAKRPQVADAKIVTSLLGYSPFDCVPLTRFQPIINNTECVFAKNSCIWAGPHRWDECLSLPQNVTQCLPALSLFVERLVWQREALDGFLVEIRGDWTSVEQFGRAVGHALHTLSEGDQARPMELPICTKRRSVNSPRWVFEFGSASFFVTTFSSIYPRNHSRHSFDADSRSGFILLQPELSFLRRNLPPDSPTTHDPPRNIRDTIRLQFRKGGQPYYIPETVHFPLAHQIVKHIPDDGSRVFDWWSPET